MSGCTGKRPEGRGERLEERDPCESAAAPCAGPAARRDGAFAWFGDMIEHCYEYASAASAAGRPIVGIMCEYTPRELIMAAGAVPVCLCGGSADTIPAAEEELPSNLCPLIKSTYGFCLEKSNPFLEMAALIVAETTCDGKKKMFELMARRKPMHLIELTQKSDDPDAFAHWHAELGKLKTALERRFGTTITDDALRAQIDIMNRERALRRNLAVLMRRARPPLTGIELLSLKTSIAAMPEALAQYERVRAELEGAEGPADMERRVRVLLTGVPVVHGAERVVELIESAGGLVVAAENCTGLKPILEDVDPNARDPLRALAEKYYRLHCSVMTPNARRRESLRELARDYRAQCVIELVWQACLTYDVEAALIRRFVEEELHLPYLRIETDYSPSDSARIQVRVEALYETVRRNAKGARAGVNGRVVYSSTFVPERAIPRRGSPPPEGVCPYAHAFADGVRAGGGAVAAVFATVCDQMRRAAETARGRDAPPLFLLNVPHTWQTAGARRYYAAELDRLGRFLCALGGAPPVDADLARVMREHDDARRAGAASAAGDVTPADGAAPVAVVGGPLSADDRVLFDLVVRAGGAVVLDATEHGERALPLPFDRRRLGGDPRGELAAAYFDGIADAARRPNTELYRWIKARLAARGVRGIIFVYYAWCDTWHAEAARMREWARLPFLCLELTGEPGAAAVLADRVEAFVETVRCGP